MDRFNESLARAVASTKLVHRIGVPTELKWNLLSVAPAREDHAFAIAQWIQGEDELVFLGGTTGADVHPQVLRWIAESHGAFVLRYEDKLVAFANVADFDRERAGADLEIGRLVVNNKWRRRGLGITLLRHLMACTRRALAEQYRLGSHVHARVASNNTPALRLVGMLPFRPVPAPKWAPRPDIDRYLWFQSRLRQSSGRTFGATLRSLRQERELAAAGLAFQVGIQRTALQMIESGSRNPSAQLLADLCDVVAESEQERLRLLVAAVGRELSDAVRFYAPLSSGEASENDDLWIVSDMLAEELDPTILATSREALYRGHDRWYFIPPGRWQERSAELTHLFAGQSRLCDAVEAGKLRFYEAPSIFCSMRVAVRNPRLTDADSVTVEAESNQRVPLSTYSAQALIASLRQVIRELVSTSATSQGFRLLFPENADGRL